MSEIIRYSPARQAMIRALGGNNKSANAIISEAPAATSGIYDLPRVCATHNKYYMSRYIDHGHGRIVYARGIRIVGAVQDQYQDIEQGVAVFKNFSYMDETCPWCGAEGFAAIRCSQCNAEVCYGRTDSNSIFSCRPGCPGKGRLQYDLRDTRAVRPGLPGGKRGS